MLRVLLAGWMALALADVAATAAVTVLVDHNDGDSASPDFHFAQAPPPSTNNAVRAGMFSVMEGEIDPNSGGLEALTDSPMPDEQDQPERNFFFAAGTDGGTLQLDLKKIVPIWQINTYSWHEGSRAPQVFKVYGANDLHQNGWTLIAGVDTRVQYGEQGGQYGVSIRASSGKLGDYRYLRFVCSETEKADAFGNTFYSKIDVLDHVETNEPDKFVAPEKPFVARTADGRYEITIDTSRVADMKEWADRKLAPVLLEWYPKIAAYFPSEGYIPPERFKVVIRPGQGVADTANARITAYVPWLRQEENGQSIGALVHEMVHVVQHYGDAPDNPGWLVEGIADYFRWYRYEPQSHGADISPRHAAHAHYDDGYRPTANYLNYLSQKYDPDLVPQLNAVMRQGKYNEQFWLRHTGRTLSQLADEWKSSLKNARSTP